MKGAHDLLRLGDAHLERLVAKHVLVSRSRGGRQRRVIRGRGIDDDRVDGRVVDDARVARPDVGLRMPFPDPVEAIVVVVRHGNQASIRIGVDQVGEREGVVPVLHSDNSDIDRFRHGLSFLASYGFVAPQPDRP